MVHPPVCCWTSNLQTLSGCWSCPVIQMLHAGGITVWFPEGEWKQEAWFSAVRYQPVRESSRALLVIPRGTLHSEEQWEALCFSLPEDSTAGFINTRFNFLTACETNDKLKKGFPQKHELWFTFPAAKCLSCPPHCLLHPHPALSLWPWQGPRNEEFSNEFTSEELAQKGNSKGPFKRPPATSVLLDSGIVCLSFRWSHL